MNQSNHSPSNPAANPEITPAEASDESTRLLIDSESTISTSDQHEHHEHHFESADIVRDVIIGLSDGLTVPFALAAGLASLNNSRLVSLSANVLMHTGRYRGSRGDHGGLHKYGTRWVFGWKE